MLNIKINMALALNGLNAVSYTACCRGVEQLTDGIGMEMDGVRGKIGSLLDLKDFFLRPKLFS